MHFPIKDFSKKFSEALISDNDLDILNYMKNIREHGEGHIFFKYLKEIDNEDISTIANVVQNLLEQYVNIHLPWEKEEVLGNKTIKTLLQHTAEQTRTAIVLRYNGNDFARCEPINGPWKTRPVVISMDPLPADTPAAKPGPFSGAAATPAIARLSAAAGLLPATAAPLPPTTDASTVGTSAPPMPGTLSPASADIHTVPPAPSPTPAVAQMGENSILDLFSMPEIVDTHSLSLSESEDESVDDNFDKIENSQSQNPNNPSTSALEQYQIDNKAKVKAVMSTFNMDVAQLRGLYSDMHAVATKMLAAMAVLEKHANTVLDMHCKAVLEGRADKPIDFKELNAQTKRPRGRPRKTPSDNTESEQPKKKRQKKN